MALFEVGFRNLGILAIMAERFKQMLDDNFPGGSGAVILSDPRSEYKSEFGSESGISTDS